MITSKLTGKAQTTIPRAVRLALRLREGDELIYSIEGETVTLAKAHLVPSAGEDPFGAFSEWNGEADRKAYADL